MKSISLLMTPMMGLTFLAPAVAFAHPLPSLSPEEIAERREAGVERRAALLGVSVEEVENAFQEGQRLWELAEEHGISKEELQERIIAAAKAHLMERMDALVADGVITEGEAEKRLEHMEKRLESHKGLHPFRHHNHGNR